jgi:Ni/Co efflux regulator RcnB
MYHRPPHRYRLGAYQRPPGYYFRQWSTGAVLPRLFWAQNYWLTSPGTYGLRPPPPGTQWVRVDYDALLISNSTGQIIDIVYNIFY